MKSTDLVWSTLKEKIILYDATSSEIVVSQVTNLLATAEKEIK